MTTPAQRAAETGTATPAWRDRSQALRVTDPKEIQEAVSKSGAMADEFQVPVGGEVSGVNEFEGLAISPEDAPTAIGLLD